MKGQLLTGVDTDAWNLGYSHGLEDNWQPNPDVPKEHLRAYRQGYCRGRLKMSQDRRKASEQLRAKGAGTPPQRSGGASPGQEDSPAA